MSFGKAFSLSEPQFLLPYNGVIIGLPHPVKVKWDFLAADFGLSPNRPPWNFNGLKCNNALLMDVQFGQGRSSAAGRSPSKVEPSPTGRRSLSMWIAPQGNLGFLRLWRLACKSEGPKGEKLVWGWNIRVTVARPLCSIDSAVIGLRFKEEGRNG